MDTIEKSLEQVYQLTGKGIKRLTGDRGYRTKREINGTQTLILHTPKASNAYYQHRKKHKLFCKRARIEASIGASED